MISLLHKDISKLKESEQKKAQTYIENSKNLQNVYSAVWEFKRTLKQKDEKSLDKWIQTVKKLGIPEFSRFVHGIERDLAAVKNAVKLNESDELAEGITNKIKVIKRIMYSRCSFELLKLEVLMLWFITFAEEPFFGCYLQERGG